MNKDKDPTSSGSNHIDIQTAELYREIVKREYTSSQRLRDSIEQRASILLALIGILIVSSFDNIKIDLHNLSESKNLLGLAIYITLSFALGFSLKSILPRESIHYDLSHVKKSLLMNYKKAIRTVIGNDVKSITAHQKNQQNKLRSFKLSCYFIVATLSLWVLYSLII